MVLKWLRSNQRGDLARGFTLIEILGVIAILAVLSGLAIGGIRGASERAQLARARSELAALAQGLEEFKRRYGDYPQSDAEGPGRDAERRDPGNGPARLFEALTGGSILPGNTRRGPALIDASQFARGFTLEGHGDGADGAFIDPWGNPYRYYHRRPGGVSNRSASVSSPRARISGYVLYSMGPDGAASAPERAGPIPHGAGDAPEDADNLHAHGP